MEQGTGSRSLTGVRMSEQKQRKVRQCVDRKHCGVLQLWRPSLCSRLSFRQRQAVRKKGKDQGQHERQMQEQEHCIQSKMTRGEEVSGNLKCGRSRQTVLQRRLERLISVLSDAKRPISPRCSMMTKSGRSSSTTRMQLPQHYCSYARSRMSSSLRMTRTFPTLVEPKFQTIDEFDNKPHDRGTDQKDTHIVCVIE